MHVETFSDDGSLMDECLDPRIKAALTKMKLSTLEELSKKTMAQVSPHCSGRTLRLLVDVMHSRGIKFKGEQ